MPKLLTLPEVQAQLRVSRATVRRLIAGGQLPIVKIGRRTLVTPQALRAFLRQREAVVPRCNGAGAGDVPPAAEE